MRQVVLDTETTGLEPEQGHRVIEIGCVELVNRRKTGRKFHRYLRPDRAIDRAAQHVHGITDEFLAQQPRFAEVVDELIEFVNGAELVIHNAAFDIAFLDAELQRLPGPARRMMRPLYGDRHAAAREADAPGPAQQSRCAVQAIQRRQLASRAARRIARRADSARRLSRHDRRPDGADSRRGHRDQRQRFARAGDGCDGRAACCAWCARATTSLAAHERILATIDKVSGGKTVWRKEAVGGWRLAVSAESSSQAAAPAYA